MAVSVATILVEAAVGSTTAKAGVATLVASAAYAAADAVAVAAADAVVVEATTRDSQVSLTDPSIT